METLTDWHRTKLTSGSEADVFHSHAYYDIPVFDSGSRFIAGHQVRFAGRQPTPEDTIEIGYIDLEGDREWTPVGVSRAWSWQQGAMTQWLPDSRRIVWNDREDDRFVARMVDVDSGETAVLPMPVYAVDPGGRFALSLNMARLDHLRPGYGYAGGTSHPLEERCSRTDGVWKLDLETGERSLILPLRKAVLFLLSRLSIRLSIKEVLKHVIRRYVYWFNHVKVSPDGSRFTVKLRFRSPDLSKSWNDQMGVSLTCGTDGRDLRLLTDGTSHVIWLDEQQLYLWQRDGVYLFRDERPEGQRRKQLAPDVLNHNVHMRHMPGTPHLFVFDTPYQEEIDLKLLNVRSGRHQTIAHFSSHRPKSGLFRCDLHPCPSPDAQKIVVTSLDDGGRQIYLLRR